MGIVGSWWRQICEPLDGLLWRKGINHGVIRPLLRNQILLAGATILAGGALFVIWPWLFWAGCGLCAMAWIYASWARFFIQTDPGNVSFFRIILKFGLRLLFFAFCLYVALSYFEAPAGAILFGLAGGAIAGLVNFALYMRGGA